MKQFLKTIILDNTIETYLYVAGAILFALLIRRFVSKYLAILLFKLFAKAGKNFHKDSFVNLIIGPLEWFLMLLMIIAALDKLTLPAILDFKLYHVSSRRFLEIVANGAMIIVFIRLCIRMVKFFSMILEQKANLTEDKADNQLIVFFRDFLKVLLIIVGGLLVLRFCFNYNISNLLTGLSIVGAAIALATKESLENLIASFIIFFDKPFVTGDVVKVNSFTGTVEKIGLRSTRIRTDQKTYITVPNKQMVDSILDNVTMRSQRKVELRLEIGLSTTSTQLTTIVAGIKKILERDEVLSKNVFVSDTGKNAHLVTVDYFTNMYQTNDQFNDTREKVNLAVIELLRTEKVDLAAASSDIVVHQKEN
ncbi:MAG: mechanosensitive ion channel [Filimonas sp.]|nr:mechanosensitive ion channel [Filimonas sp.]